MAMSQEQPPQASPSVSLGVDAAEYDGGLSAFFKARPRLFGIAYRMLGSAAEAEDCESKRGREPDGIPSNYNHPPMY